MHQSLEPHLKLSRRLDDEGGPESLVYTGGGWVCRRWFGSGGS
jgi:hypothetical protein